VKVAFKARRLSPGMAIPDFEAQGTRHKAQGKLNIQLKLPCALRLGP
jgi:hypothetical protein